MNPQQIQEWNRAYGEPGVRSAVEKVRSQWPRLPFPMLLEIALTEWAGDGSTSDREYQTAVIAAAIGVDPVEAQADAADARKAAGHG